MLQILGEGGMGRVLLAEHVVMRTRHAIKVLHDELSRNELIVQRFLNEARSAGAIGHRNVVEITHVDQMEGGGAWYLVMKYLEGRTLTSFLASAGSRIEQRLIVHVLGEALNGLQAAHDRRIIHRDLKPDNLYVTSVKEDPYRTILLDFGVAQLGHDARVVTRTGAMIGTPQYMAPEQHRGAPIDLRADLWAMGAIAYEMITGRLPYQNDDAERNVLTGPEIFHRMMTRPVVDPRQYNPAITEAFARATLTALAIDPAARPESARALALMFAEATPGGTGAPSGIDILRKYADELLEREAIPRATSAAVEGDRSAWIAAAPARLSTLGAVASQSFPAVSPARPRRRGTLLALVVGFAAAAGIGGILLLRHGSPASTVPSQPASTLPGNAASAPTPAHADTDTAARTPGAEPAGATRAAVGAPAADAGVPDASRMAVSSPEAGTTTSRRGGSPPAVGATSAQQPTASPRGAAVRSGAPGAARTEPVATGKLDVVVLPWAEVWVDGKPLGQTPVTAKVPVGTHRVRLKNDVKEKTVTVTVTSSRTAVIDESW
ncbi:MAG TPA: protein kinase [Kofleriaceae bacterium]|nr:protein kinase [Kofleriaceae bacterium]